MERKPPGESEDAREVSPPDMSGKEYFDKPYDEVPRVSQKLATKMKSCTHRGPRGGWGGARPTRRRLPLHEYVNGRRLYNANQQHGPDLAESF